MNGPITERVIEIPWALMHLPQSGVVLDVGSCDATYLRIIQQPSRILHCLDPRDCRDSMPDSAVFYHDSIVGNSLPKAYYDAVLMLSTIEHIGLPCYGHQPFAYGDLLALAEARALLKPGCPVIVTMPAGQSKVVSWYRQYSPADLKRLFRGWQFEIQYWGFDNNGYHSIAEHDVERYDYRDYPVIGAGSGALAGVVAYSA